MSKNDGSLRSLLQIIWVECEGSICTIKKTNKKLNSYSLENELNEKQRHQSEYVTQGLKNSEQEYYDKGTRISPKNKQVLYQ